MLDVTIVLLSICACCDWVLRFYIISNYLHIFFLIHMPDGGKFCCITSYVIRIFIEWLSVSVFFQDDEGNLLETEFGLSTYKDHQTFSIQVSIW